MDYLEVNAARLEIAGKQQEAGVLYSVSAAGIGPLCYAYKLRIKSTAKLIEKVHRKSRQKAGYSVEKITDVIGIRLITLFKNEISAVLARVIDLLQHASALHPNPFMRNALEEVIIYTNSPPHDTLLTEMKNILTEKNILYSVVDPREGYSSVHVVTRLSACAVLNRDKETQYDSFLPVEIQIRSVFEDAWGEIDHKFGYTLRAGKKVDNLLYNLPLVQPHLKVLKQFSDACAQYADVIYASAHTPVSVKDVSGKIASIPSDDLVLQRFAELDLPQKFADRYVQGRGLREAALQLIASDKAAGQEQCLKAAAFFLTLYQSAAAELPASAGTSLFLFYAQMNEALCLLSTQSPQHVQTAKQTYLKLRESYPGYTLVQFRLAQAEARLGNIDESLKLFTATGREIAEVRRKATPGMTWPDRLPQTDFIHIESLLSKLMGYQYWRKANEEVDPDKKLENYLLAHDTTRSSSTEPGELSKIANNRLYFAIDYLALHQGEPTAITRRLGRSLHKNLRLLERTLNNPTAGPDLLTLDTMMTAYSFLDRIDSAQKIANRILELGKDAPPANPESTLEIIKKALHVKSLQGPSMPPPHA